MKQRTELLIVSAVALLLIGIGTALLFFAPALDARLSLAVTQTFRATLFEPVLVAATHLGDLWLWIAVMMALLWAGELEAGLSLGAALIGTFVNPVLKAATGIPRPETALTGPVRPGGFSFPSGHAQLAAAASSVLGVGRDPKARGLLLALALVVAFSRVALGVHRLSDIFAGLGVGILIGTAATAAAHRWLRLRPTTRLRVLPAGPAFVAVALVFGPANLHAAAAAAGGLLFGACLGPLYRLRDVRLDFTWRRLMMRAAIAATGTATLTIGYAFLGPPGRLWVAGLFGSWVTWLAPVAFRAARAG